MAPDESDGARTGNDVTVKVDVNPFANVVTLQISTEFKPNTRNI